MVDARELRAGIERFAGLEQGMDEADMPATMSRAAQCCDTSGGRLTPAAGVLVDDGFAAAPGAIRTVMKYQPQGGTEITVIATDTGLYRWSGTAWVSIAGALPVSSGYFSWTNARRLGRDVLAMANGLDDAYCWSGSGTIERLAADAPWCEGRPQGDPAGGWLRLTRHGFAEGEALVFDGAAGVLPAGLSENRVYFVRDRAGDCFRISELPGGAAVAIRSAGTPGWRVGRPKWLSAAVSGGAFACTAHGLMQNDRLVIEQVAATGKAPAGTAFRMVYWAQVLDDNRFALGASADAAAAIAITGAGAGWRIRRFDTGGWATGAPEGDALSGQLRLTNHGLKNGQAVECGADASAVLPGGLSAGAVYYVRVLDANSFKLALSPGGVPVNLTGEGGGCWAIRAMNDPEWRGETPAVNKDTDALTLAAHGFAEGAAVRVGIADENGFYPDGLLAGVEYAVMDATDSTLRLRLPGGSAALDITGGMLMGWGLRRVGGTDFAGGEAWAVPADDTIQTTGLHGLKDGDRVVLGLIESRILPGGVTAGRVYYVRTPTANEFKIAETRGGAVMQRVWSGFPGWRVRAEGGAWKAGLPRVKSTDRSTFILAGHGFAEGAAVVFDLPTQDGFLPGGLTAHSGGQGGKFYYVANATAHTFRLTERLSAAPVKLTGAGHPAFRIRPSDGNKPGGAFLLNWAGRLWSAGAFGPFFSGAATAAANGSRDGGVVCSGVDSSDWAAATGSGGGAASAGANGSVTVTVAEPVTAFAELFGAPAAFTARGLCRVLGTYPGDWAAASVAAEAGTLSPRTVRMLGGAAYWLAPGGIQMWEGDRAATLRPGALVDILAGLNRDPAVLGKACAAVSGSRLLIAVATAGSTENDAVIEYDAAQGTLMWHPGCAVSCWMDGEPLRFARGNRIFLWCAGGAGASLVEDPAPYMRWETPRNLLANSAGVGRSQTGAGRGPAARVTRVLVEGRGGALKITVRADGGSAYPAGRQTTRTVVLPENGGIVSARFALSGRRVGLVLENVDGSRPEVSGVTIVYEEEAG